MVYRLFGCLVLPLLLLGCGTPPKDYIAWKGCVPGEEAEFVACDQLHVVAGWSGVCSNPTVAAQCFYTPPSGYVFLDSRVQYNSGPNGRTTYGTATLAEGAKILSKSDIELKFNQAIDLAAKWADFEAQAKLSEEKNETLRLYEQIETNKNLLRATVTAKGDGHCADRRRSWINVTVKARAICMGVPDQTLTASSNFSSQRTEKSTITCCAPNNASCIEGVCEANEVPSCELDANHRPIVKCSRQ